MAATTAEALLDGGLPYQALNTLQEELQTCHALLARKERELTVAAELGQQLLDENASLKNECQKSRPFGHEELTGEEAASRERGTSWTVNSRVQSRGDGAELISTKLAVPKNVTGRPRGGDAMPSVEHSRQETPGKSTHRNLPSHAKRTSRKRNSASSHTNPDYPETSPPSIHQSRLSQGSYFPPSPSSNNHQFDLSEYISHLERSNADLQMQIEELLLQLRETRSQLNKSEVTTETQLQDMHSDMHQLVEDHDALKKENQTLRQKMAQQRRDTHSVHSEDQVLVSTLQHRITQLEVQLSREASLRSSAEEKWKLSLAELSRLQEFEQAASEVNELRQVCASQEGLVAELQEQLADAQNRYDALRRGETDDFIHGGDDGGDSQQDDALGDPHNTWNPDEAACLAMDGQMFFPSLSPIRNLFMTAPTSPDKTSPHKSSNPTRLEMSEQFDRANRTPSPSKNRRTLFVSATTPASPSPFSSPRKSLVSTPADSSFGNDDQSWNVQHLLNEGMPPRCLRSELGRCTPAEGRSPEKFGRDEPQVAQSPQAASHSSVALVAPRQQDVAEEHGTLLGILWQYLEGVMTAGPF
ncbi:hypothetical protein DFS34DRAFT_73723 [Phlyctochytrium arcticum]|nr:hypothetical protein DFS34DRAFT_73723 [Phlyctochytrium arcticum]